MMCEGCALRLFNDKCHNLQGVGNPWCGRVVIIPNVDYGAYKFKDMAFSASVEVISNVISSTGRLENLYVQPLIRCTETTGCEANSDIITRCMSYLAEDFRTYQWKDVMLCGLSATRFLNVDVKDNLNSIFISANKVRYVVNYNPLVKHFNDVQYNKFCKYFMKWYFSSITQDYSEYNFVNI